MELTAINISNPSTLYVSNEEDEQCTPANNFISNFFQSRSHAFREWLDIRLRGANNNTIKTFFDGRAGNSQANFRDCKVLSNPNYVQEQFRKFCLQIRDIDMDVDMSSEIKQRCSMKRTPESFSFLEFGCAPGGIATFILDINWKIHGGGITLPIDLGGYGISPHLQNDPRFQTVYADATEEAKNDRDLLNHFSDFRHPRFTGFDFIINGITIHRQTHSKQRVEIALSQLYYALKLLQDSGMLLVVLNACLGFFYLQYLYILLNLFDKCKAVKPIAIYPIRKSYWIFCTGFRKHKLQNWDLIRALQEVLTSAKDLELKELEVHFDSIYYLGNIFPVPGDTYKLEIAKMIAVKWGFQIIELMNPVWERQIKSIEQVLEGKKWLVCQRGKSCTRASCLPSKAHSKDELITIVKDRLQKLHALKQL